MAKVYYWAWTDHGVGHLSLKLDDGTYISHWPDGSAQPWNPPMKGATSSLEEDEEAEKRPADEIVVLPKEMIDCEKIRKWWKETQKKGTKYQTVFSNCAQMVEAALKEGGIAKYEPLSWDDGHHTSITPYDILTWIKACKDKYNSPSSSLLGKLVSGLFKKEGKKG